MEYPFEVRRHSAAHLTAAAAQRLFPNAKFGVGPVVENGFYYDIDIDRPLTTDDLKAISKAMQGIQRENPAFVREELAIDDAIHLFGELNQPYKVELLQDLKTKGTTKVSTEEAQDIDPQNVGTVTAYRTGTFVDLCRGPHVTEARDIGSAWKLTKIAGAYWRGKETNPQMQRIYGFCFATVEELDAYETMMAEAEKRDHRKLGKELDLFVFSDLVGPGLPLFTPRGTVIRELLNAYVQELRQQLGGGYQAVTIPHITKKDLYEKSGHWKKFADELFKINTREGHEFAMKPMNCPHHAQIYASQARSYRQLPIRYRETTMVYRDEQSGELSGLSRVRSITQDDAHVFCRASQIEEEIERIWNVVQTFYGTFGLELTVRFSRHDPSKMQQYSGTEETWERAEKQLKTVVENRGVAYTDGMGEAAFYGPKIDFMGRDVFGRTFQAATIQLDFGQPEGFDLICTNEAGERERVVMVHCAIMGSLERFMVLLIEHFGGAFPFWLAPVQVAVLPVADRHIEFAQALAKELSAVGLRVLVDDSTESVGKKIRTAEKQKYPRMLVVGDRESDGGNLTVRVRGEQDQREMSKQDFLEEVSAQISSHAI